jgi:hypothetical protein
MATPALQVEYTPSEDQSLHLNNPQPTQIGNSTLLLVSHNQKLHCARLLPLLIRNGKAILVHAYSGPEGSRMLRLQDFMTIGV